MTLRDALRERVAAHLGPRNASQRALQALSARVDRLHAGPTLPIAPTADVARLIGDIQAFTRDLVRVRGRAVEARRAAASALDAARRALQIAEESE